MKITTEIELERENGEVLVECEAEVRKHFGRLEVSDFTSDPEKLTPDEIEQCHEALMEKARHDSGLCIPEEEEGATRFHRFY